MIVNFRARGISRGARKLARTSTLNLKKRMKSFITLRGAIQLIRSWICFLEITSLILRNLKTTIDLHGR